MLNLTSNCMKCKEEMCIRCNGNRYKADRIKQLVQARNIIIQKGKLGFVGVVDGVARINQIDQKLSGLQNAE